jgi:hypothetical protein
MPEMPEPRYLRDLPGYAGDEAAVAAVMEDLFPARMLQPAFESCVEGTPAEYHEAIRGLRANFEHRTRIFVESLGLNLTRPRRIIDIDTGMAHFPRICEYFGHDTECTSLETEDRRDYYVCVREALGYPPPADLEVRAFSPLPARYAGYDDMVFLSPTFNMTHGERHWDTSGFWPAEPWLFLFEDLFTRLAPGGRIYMYAARCDTAILRTLLERFRSRCRFLKAKPWDGDKDFGELHFQRMG